MIYIDVPAKTTFDRWNLHYVKRLKKGKRDWFLQLDDFCHDRIHTIIPFLSISIAQEYFTENEIEYFLRYVLTISLYMSA